MSKLCLCVPSSCFEQEGCYEDIESIESIKPKTVLIERGIAETDIEHRQLIPYVYLYRRVNHCREVLTYQRPSKQTEQRLAGLKSIGFGGHVEPHDVPEHVPYLGEMLILCLERELREEVGLRPPFIPFYECHLVLNDTVVNQVHAGLVFRVEIAPEQELSPSSEVSNLEWLPVQSLKDRVRDEPKSWEQWTRTLVEERF